MFTMHNFGVGYVTKVGFEEWNVVVDVKGPQYPDTCLVWHSGRLKNCVFALDQFIRKNDKFITVQQVFHKNFNEQFLNYRLILCWATTFQTAGSVMNKKISWASLYGKNS